MIEKLKNLLNNSYSPYSHFKVACIVLMKDGREFTGVNVENASYGSTICAERVAITQAITAGYKKGDFFKLYVMVDSEKIGTCCFACRQVIQEFFEPVQEVVMMDKLGNQLTKTVAMLCPYPFNEDNLS